MRRALVPIFAFAFAAAACGGQGGADGSAASAPACAATGSADPAAFGRSFSAMTLTGGAAGDQESEASFAKDQTVVVSATALSAVSARFCVNYRDGSGRIPADITRDLPAGESRIALGTFGAASYVVRVTAAGALVRNLTFVVR